MKECDIIKPEKRQYMKTKIWFLVLVVMALFLSGCEQNEEVISNGKKVNTNKMVHYHCARNGSIDDGDISLQYELYATGEVLNILKSEEKVISANEEILTEYEEAYRKIHAHYEGLEYYDTEVIRGDTTVTSKITINYDKINIQKLLEIEGAEGNIIENGVAKVDKWKEFAKKFGTSCKTVEEDSF